MYLFYIFCLCIYVFTMSNQTYSICVDHLSTNASAFRMKAQVLHRTMWWKECRVINYQLLIKQRDINYNTVDLKTVLY